MLGRGSRGPAPLQRHAGAHRSASPRLAPLLLPPPPPRLLAPHNGTIHPPSSRCPRLPHRTGSGQCPPRAGQAGAASSRSPREPPHGQRLPSATAPPAPRARNASNDPRATAATAPAAAPLRRGGAVRQQHSTSPQAAPRSLSAPRPKERNLRARGGGVPPLSARPGTTTPQAARGWLCPAGRGRGRPAGAREDLWPCQPRWGSPTAAAPRGARPSLRRRKPRPLRLSHENNYWLARGRGGEVKSHEAEERRLVAASSLSAAPGPPPRRRQAPHPPGGSPSRPHSTTNSEPAAWTHPFMSSWALPGGGNRLKVWGGWLRRRGRETARAAATGRRGCLTEPLPPPAAAALSTRCSPAAFCVLLAAPRLPSAFVFVCNKKEKKKKKKRSRAREGAQPSAPASHLGPRCRRAEQPGRKRGRARAPGGACCRAAGVGVFPPAGRWVRRGEGARSSWVSPPRAAAASAAAAGASGAARLGAAGSVARLRQSRCAASGRRERRRRRGKEGGEEGSGAAVPCGVRVGGEGCRGAPGPPRPAGRRGWLLPSQARRRQPGTGRHRGRGQGKGLAFFRCRGRREGALGSGHRFWERAAAPLRRDRRVPQIPSSRLPRPRTPPGAVTCSGRARSYPRGSSFGESGKRSGSSAGAPPLHRVSPQPGGEGRRGGRGWQPGPHRREPPRSAPTLCRLGAGGREWRKKR